MFKRFYARQATRVKTSLTIEQFESCERVNRIRQEAPFPMNPTFKPIPVIAESTRTAIYNLYKQDPAKWTFRALAEQFGISIIRTEAILKLKALETVNQANGIPSQTEFVTGMEKMLETRVMDGTKKAKRVEPLREGLDEGFNPFIQLMDEEDHLTPEDAADLLHLEPYANIKKRLSIKANSMFKENVEVSGKPAAKEIDPVMGGKTNFVITDISNPEGVKVTIREKDGTLRNASKSEVYLKKHKQIKFTM